MPITGFHKIELSTEPGLFDDLTRSIQFEATGKGRVGNHLVCEEENGIPLVRTTSKYNGPAFSFSSKHKMIIDKINEQLDNLNLSTSLHFNNALIEIYERSYTKMKFHSDQCLDVDKDSYIALFTCYEKPEELAAQAIRKLKIKDKETNKESEFTLTHNSVILFSVATNSKYLHKIVLESVRGMKPLATDNRWLGITFRKSSTFIRFENNTPYFPNGKTLTLATEDQTNEFYKLRGEENKSMSFDYPELFYTLSLADTLRPIQEHAF